MAKSDSIEVQIEFPDAPKLSDRPDKQQDFDRWYFELKTCMVRQFQVFADEIEELKRKK